MHSGELVPPSPNYVYRVLSLSLARALRTTLTSNLADLIGFIQLCGLLFRILLIFTRFGGDGRRSYVIFDAAAPIFVVRRRGRRHLGCCRLRCLRRRLLHHLLYSINLEAED